MLSHRFQRDPLFKDRLLVLRHDDMLQAPDRILTAICRFLGVPFDERMLDTSQYDDFVTKGTWQGNSAFDKKVVGFSPARAVRWKETLPVMTAKAIEYFAFHEMALAGYQVDHPLDALDDGEIMNYVIQHDYETPVKWRTDAGTPIMDLSLETLRHAVLRSTTPLTDQTLVRKCFLFEEFAGRAVPPLTLV